MSNKQTLFQILCIALIGSVLLSSCAGSLASSRGNNYIFSYSLTEPVRNNELIFRDKYIIVQFTIDESAISFQMQNISEARMSIVWDNVSLGVNNRTFSVRNKSNFYSTNTSFADVVIPPLGYIREIVIPRENVFIKDGEWVERQFFITNDRGSKQLESVIQRYRGDQLSLMLPIKIGEIVVPYQFVFTVSKITKLPSNLLPPVKVRPPKPKVSVQEAGSGAEIMPIVVAAIVLGLTAYILSKKKTPAGDI